MDYLDELSSKDLEWLNTFVEEEVHARLDHDDKPLNRKKKDKKRIYDNNNSRNRDIYTKGRLSGGEIPDTVSDNSTEDMMIELLDLKLVVEDLNNIKDSYRKRRKKRNNTKKL